MSDPVIVGVDGSASGFDAVDLAAREAHPREAPLRIVLALGRPSVRLPTGTAPWNPGDQGLEAMALGVLARAEERAHQVAPGIEITRSVGAGEAFEVLEIESRSAVPAALGSRGRSAFAGLLLGSTAVRLAAHGRCPLMVVRGRAAPTGPVLLAVDGSPAGQAAVEFAFAETALRKAPLVARHVWNTWSEGAYEGPGDPLTAVVVDVAHLRETGQHLMDVAVASSQEDVPQVAVERRPVRSRIRPALIDVSRQAQLVVTGARGRGGFTALLLGSVGQALLHHAHCTVTVTVTVVRGKE
ncbi:universal stress protein [Streptomyces sp. NPDC101225]|uniref:universal stress protein n=1 Tax=Streptomyces sp. NPDC101225 TaxID=3366135 RepID=UPI003828648F